MSLYRTIRSWINKSSASQIWIWNNTENMVHNTAKSSGTSEKSYFKDVLGWSEKSKCRSTDWRFLWYCAWKAKEYGNPLCGNAGCKRI